jgi:two-component system sensor histidine kinase/response regulator
MNLLIVDDQPTNQKLLRAQLEAEGHAVLEAADGVEALRVLENKSVDAIISDILMPNMDGFRLCLEIRKKDKFAAVPFILYTSTYNSAQDRQLAQSAGADHYITKPAPIPVILDAVREAVQKLRGTMRPAAPKPDEAYVLKQYSEVLVHKLEEQNFELNDTLKKLQTAQEQVLELNRSLESRILQRTAELEAANKELEAFSYSVSHDLRAPLRSIDGFSSILLRDHAGSLSAEGQRCLGVVRERAQHMARLIDDLLNLSRTGRQPVAKQTIALKNLVNQCLEEFRDEIAKRNVEIVLGELPEGRADPALLRQVLLNLLGNALKYTRKQPRARIEVACRSRDGKQVICVKDNGVGFDMNHAGKLFGVFQRMHRSEDFEGTGVGLAIVERIVRRHGGRAWAEAEPGKGATFYFTLGEAEA